MSLEYEHNHSDLSDTSNIIINEVDSGEGSAKDRISYTTEQKDTMFEQARGINSIRVYNPDSTINLDKTREERKKFIKQRQLEPEADFYRGMHITEDSDSLPIFAPKPFAKKVDSAESGS